jgi:hypothetical protein
VRDFDEQLWGISATGVTVEVISRRDGRNRRASGTYERIGVDFRFV